MMQHQIVQQLSKLLPELLTYLDKAQIHDSIMWQEWQLTPIAGGANNLVYRAQRHDLDLAIKFTIRDARRRAWREYNALFALQHGGYTLAPRPLWLDETSYRQPVVVQSWATGEVLSEPPQSAAAWNQLLLHYAELHTLTPKRCHLPLRGAVIVFNSGEHGKTAVLQAAQQLPTNEHPPKLNHWLRWLRQWQPPAFPTPPLALCRNDANWRNFIRQNGRLLSVDWENSGWGDPTFELADLITHPAYETVPDTRWPTVVDRYAELTQDKTAVLRIHTYTRLMLIWWLIRWSRYLYEVPRGLDNRLVQRPLHWEKRTRLKFAQYVTKLETMQAIFDV